jgi:hypothetical protein
MLFWLKYNTVSPVKLRTGSSVPAMAQRRTNTLTQNKTHHNKRSQTSDLIEQPCSHDTTATMRRHTPRDQTHVDKRATGCSTALR